MNSICVFTAPCSVHLFSCFVLYIFIEAIFLLKPLEELRAKRKGTQMFCCVMLALV